MSDPLPPKTNVPIEDRLTERAAKGEFDPVRDCKHGHLARSCDLCELEELRIQSKQLREALLLYHEAWNGCERDWHSAMREASKNAEKVLWGKEKK